MSSEGWESIDDALDALGHVQRRRLLVALLAHNPQDDAPMTVVEDAVDTGALDRIVQMEHVHLPKLVDYGYIEWDRENGEVATGPNFEEIRPLLELLVDHENELPDDWL
jgi:hypothetical protein